MESFADRKPGEWVVLAYLAALVLVGGLLRWSLEWVEPFAANYLLLLSCTAVELAQLSIAILWFARSRSSLTWRVAVLFVLVCAMALVSSWGAGVELLFATFCQKLVDLLGQGALVTCVLAVVRSRGYWQPADFDSGTAARADVTKTSASPGSARRSSALLVVLAIAFVAILSGWVPLHPYALFFRLRSLVWLPGLSSAGFAVALPIDAPVQALVTLAALGFALARWPRAVRVALLLLACMVQAIWIWGGEVGGAPATAEQVALVLAWLSLARRTRSLSLTAISSTEK